MLIKRNVNLKENKYCVNELSGEDHEHRRINHGEKHLRRLEEAFMKST